ncbi:hypothetical protein JMUB6875_75530 [Nocardia sp. JMUB6875]
MASKPIALGYLRRDISGRHQSWDEHRIRGLATRLGYALERIVVFTDTTEDRVAGLIAIAARCGAEAVLTPGLAHFDGARPDALIEVADLITIDPHQTFARWIIPPDAPYEMRTR